jgi:hypothetical protein
MLSRKSFTNLQALASGDFGGSLGELQGGGPLSHTTNASKGSRASIDSDSGKKSQRYGAAGSLAISEFVTASTSPAMPDASPF